MTLNRISLICLAALGVTWVTLYVIALGQAADDRTFYSERIEKPMQSDKIEQISGDLNEWMNRAARRRHNATLREGLFLSAMALTVIWVFAGLIRNEIFHKKRAALARPPDPGTGLAIEEAKRQGSRLVAGQRNDSPSGARRHEVEVDFREHTITFRHFTFIAAFVGNTSVAERTLPFTEVLGGRVWAYHGHVHLVLRTTAGKVTIPYTLESFITLGRVLLDIAEVNRKNPAVYAAALAREPKIKTPWYGWLIILGALGALAGLSAFLWNLS